MADAARYRQQFTPGDIPRGIQAMAYANPLDSALDTVEKFAERSAVERGTQQATDQVLSGENPGPALGLTPGGQAFNHAAQAAFAARSEGVLRAKSTELAARYSGRNPTDADSFAKVYDAVAREVTSSVPEAWRAPIALEAQVRGQEAVANIRGRSMQFEYAKSVESIEGGRLADVAEAASFAQLGRHDLTDAALAKADAKTQSLVEIGAINQDEANLRKKDGREDIAVETLYRGFLDGHVSPQAVQSGAVGAELSAPKRDRLVNKMEGEIRHRASVAASARSEAAAGHKQNGVVANTYAKAIENNIPLDPNQQREADALLTQERQARAAGLSTMPDAAFRNLEEASVVRNVTGDVVRGTVADAQLALARIDAHQPRDMVELGIKEKSRKVVEGFIADVTGDDPVGKLQQRGAFFRGLPPVDFSSPDAFAQTLAARGRTIDAASMQFGRDLPALSKLESEQFTASMKGWNETEQSTALAAVNAQGPEAAAHTLGTVSKSGAPVLSHAGYLAGVGAAGVSARVLHGQKLRDADLWKKPAGFDLEAAGSTDPIIAALPTETATALVESATALVADSGGQLTMDKALEQVGGKMGQYGSKQILLPYDASKQQVVDSTTFGNTLDQVTDAEVVKMGGTPAAAAMIRGGNVTLDSFGGGHYLVTAGPGIPPFVLDWSKISPKEKPPLSISVGGADIGPALAGVAPTIGKGIDAVAETGRAVFHNTADPLAKLLRDYGPAVPGPN